MPRRRKPTPVVSLVDFVSPNTQFRSDRERSVDFAKNLPALADTANNSEVVERLLQTLVSDPVVKSAESHADSLDFLQTLKLEAAKETAFISQQKYNPNLSVEDVVEIATKRINSLMKLASLEKDIQKNTIALVDLHNERFQKVFQFWLETLKEVAESIMAPEQVDLLFNKLEVALSGWEDKASVKMLPAGK